MGLKCMMCLAEITSGGLTGICGLDQIDWGGQAGSVYECWKCAPCCGSPDIINALLCLVNWSCLAPCSMCKLYATSLSQNCAIWPHCCCIALFCCGRLFTRYNLRKKSGVKGNIVGDIVCITCCPVCTLCQELRSVGIDGWRVLPECSCVDIMAPGCHFIR